MKLKNYLLVFLILFINCGDTTTKQKKIESMPFGDNNGWSFTIEHSVYKEHNYLVFGMTSVVHDPDCLNLKCKK